MSLSYLLSIANLFQIIIKILVLSMNPFSLQKVIELRQSIHSYPEPGFQEFQTKKKIIQFLTWIGVEQSCMKELATTGMIFDVKGRAPASGKNKTIAFRADMDALTMTEENTHLHYMSKRPGLAHMCGHDGHVASLVAFAWKYMSELQKIPENKIIRLLFQPSEQGPKSGAKQMIEEGVLDGVDEIYGYHNWPNDFPGKIYVKQGPVMAESTTIRLKVLGTPGHGSAPELVKDAVNASIRLYQSAMDITEKLTKEGRNFICSLPVFKGGQRCNVFSEDCIVQGSIRSFEPGLNQNIINKIYETKEQLEKEGFKIEFLHPNYAPMNNNTKSQAEHVERCAKKVYGQENVSKGILPIRASEDFAYFTQLIPGAFFFATSARMVNSPACHSNNYDFNDQLLSKVSDLWLELALDRLRDEE